MVGGPRIAVGRAAAARGPLDARRGSRRGRLSTEAARRMNEYREAQALAASTVRRERVEWCPGQLAGRVAFGALTALVGDAGLGKSTWTCAAAAELSQRGISVLMATAEDSFAMTVKPRLEAVGADLDRVHFVLIR